MNEKDTLRYIVYARKSSEAKEKQALSIETQREKALEIFGNRKVVAVLEESKSAFNPQNRAVFSEMIQMLNDGKADGIIAWHPDRLSRNEKDAAEITYLIRTGVIKNLLFGSYTFNNSPEGILFLQMALNQSQYSSAKLSVDVKRGLEKKIKMGQRPGTAPHGYRNTKFAERGTNYIVKDEAHYSIIRRVWEHMLTGNYGPAEMLALLNDEWGFRTRQTKKRGGTPLTKGGLYEILKNPFYAGWMEYSGHYERGTHEPMVTDLEFDRMQVLLGRYGRPRAQRYEYAYTGQVKCGECGGVISATYREKAIKTTGEVKAYTLYYCTNARRKEEKCFQRHYTNVERMEEVLETELAALTLHPWVLEWAVGIIDREAGAERQTLEAVDSARQKAIQGCETRFRNLMDMRAKDLISDEEFASARASIKTEEGRFRSEAATKEQNAVRWVELTKDTFSFATYAYATYLKGDAKMRHEILESVSGLNCTLKDHILNVKAVEWLVPIQERAVSLNAEIESFEPEMSRTSWTENAFEHFSPVVRGRRDLNPRSPP